MISQLHKVVHKKKHPIQNIIQFLELLLAIAKYYERLYCLPSKRGTGDMPVVEASIETIEFPTPVIESTPPKSSETTAVVHPSLSPAPEKPQPSLFLLLIATIRMSQMLRELALALNEAGPEGLTKDELVPMITKWMKNPPSEDAIQRAVNRLSHILAANNIPFEAHSANINASPSSATNRPGPKRKFDDDLFHAYLEPRRPKKTSVSQS